MIEAAAAYNAVAESYDDHYDDAISRAENADLARMLRRRLRYADNVLDVGCGTGLVPDLVPEHCEPGWYLGVDISSGMLNVAQRKHPDLDFALCDMADLLGCVRGGYWGAVVSTFGSFAYTDRPLSALTDMTRMLHPGGRLFLMTPSHTHEQRDNYVLAGEDVPFHTYGPLSLWAMAKAAGLDKIRVTGYAYGSKHLRLERLTLGRVAKSFGTYLILDGVRRG